MATRYSPDEIHVLEGVEQVRLRPHYFVRDVRTSSGMHQLLYRLIEIVIAEHRRGVVHHLRIAIDGDTVTIEDDGTGIPIDAWNFVMTQISHRADNSLPNALVDYAIPVANALSSDFEVTVWRDGQERMQAFKRGAPLGPMQVRGATTRTGTRFVFTPDFTILAHHPWNLIAIGQRCSAFAGLFPGLVIELNKDVYRYDAILDCVRDLGAGDLIEPLLVHRSHELVDIDLALAWAKHGVMQCFADYRAQESGAHVDAMRAAIRSVLERRNASTERIEQHLVVVLSVVANDPQLGHLPENPAVGDVLRGVVERELARHLEATPALLDRILIDLE